MSRAAARVLAALEADRAALLSGDYNAVPHPSLHPAAALPTGLETADIQRIAAAARRNLALVEAARAGFRAADPGLRAGAGVTTYGADGGTTALVAAGSSHDLRR